MTKLTRNGSPDALLQAAERGKLPRRLEKYLNSCRPPPDSDPKKSPRSFPNLAGFCRHMGCGISAMETLRASDPALYGYICAVLEDEALNFSLSPTVMSAYLKQRLGYGDKQESGNSTADCGQLRLVFEHDIMEDGA